MAIAGFTKAEIERVAEVAKKAGVRIEFERNGAFLRAGPGLDEPMKVEQKSEQDVPVLM